MKSIKDFYNKTSSDWANKWYEDESMLPFLKNFINRFSFKPRILDLCCGAGYESMRIHKLGAEVIGLDFSEESIKIAQERNPNINFFVGDMLEDYSYVGTVDGIVVIAGFIHLPNEKLRLAFDNANRVLKENGLMLVVVRDGSGKNDSSSYVTIDGEEYDREFYNHTQNELVEAAEGILKFIEVILPDDNDLWKTYIFKKI